MNDRFDDLPWWEVPVFHPRIEWAPFVTSKHLARLDFLKRRRLGVDAVLRGRDGWRLWADVYAEREAIDAAHDKLFDEIDLAAAAWCSWPPEEATA